jgi:hypothetical protein
MTLGPRYWSVSGPKVQPFSVSTSSIIATSSCVHASGSQEDDVYSMSIKHQRSIIKASSQIPKSTFILYLRFVGAQRPYSFITSSPVEYEAVVSASRPASRTPEFKLQSRREPRITDSQLSGLMLCGDHHSSLYRPSIPPLSTNNHLRYVRFILGDHALAHSIRNLGLEGEWCRDCCLLESMKDVRGDRNDTLDRKEREKEPYSRPIHAEDGHKCRRPGSISIKFIPTANNLPASGVLLVFVGCRGRKYLGSFAQVESIPTPPADAQKERRNKRSTCRRPRHKSNSGPVRPRKTAKKW